MDCTPYCWIAIILVPRVHYACEALYFERLSLVSCAPVVMFLGYLSLACFQRGTNTDSGSTCRAAAFDGIAE